MFRASKSNDLFMGMKIKLCNTFSLDPETSHSIERDDVTDSSAEVEPFSNFRVFEDAPAHTDAGSDEGTVRQVFDRGGHSLIWFFLLLLPCSLQHDSFLQDPWRGERTITGRSENVRETREVSKADCGSHQWILLGRRPRGTHFLQSHCSASR